MQEARTSGFKRAYRKLSPSTQKACDKQVRFLITDIRHPPLRAKKYDEGKGIWQARVSDNVRLYFLIVGTTYLLLDIERHKD